MMFQMGDPSVEVTEESRDASQSAKAKAMEAISEGDFHGEVNNELTWMYIILNKIKGFSFFKGFFNLASKINLF